MRGVAELLVCERRLLFLQLLSSLDSFCELRFFIQLFFFQKLSHVAQDILELFM